MTNQFNFNPNIFENGSIHKGFTEDPYFQMLNAAAQDKEISAQAKGVLATLLSLPPTWKIRKKDLNQHHKNGRDAIIKAFDELVEATYILKIQIPGGRGKFPSISYQIFKKRQGIEAQQQIQAEAEKYFQAMKEQPQASAPTEQPTLEQKPKAEPKPKPAAKQKEEIPYQEILDYLFEKTGKKYGTGENNIKFIRARWNQGFKSVDDYKKVIDIKTKQWLNNENEKYLRPQTLFGTLFEGYWNENPNVQPQPKPYQGKKNEDFASHLLEKNNQTNHFAEIDGITYDLRIPEQKAKVMELTLN